MEKAAASFGIERPIIRWIAAMLRTRAVSSSLSDSTVRALAGRGCPQGGVISPLLWLLVVNGLLAGLEELGAEAIGYADDVALLVSSKDGGTLSFKMQKALDHVQRWCTSNGLKVNPRKTEMVLYTDKRKLVVKPPSIYNTVLSFSEDVKYLGLWIDRRLSWKKHINMQTSKVIGTYWDCRRMFGSTWGLRLKVVRWIYTAIMLPQLTYPAVAWWPAMNKACHRKTNDSHLGIGGATLHAAATPHHKRCGAVNSSQAETNWHLEGSHLEEAKKGHALLLTEDRVLFGSLSKGGDACRTEWHRHKRFKVNLGTVDTQAWVDSKWSPPHGLVWYTDGSKRCGRAGAGVWSNRPSAEKALGLDPHATPLQTELAALRACARIILARQDKGKVVHINGAYPKSVKEQFNSGSVPYELIIQSNTSVTDLGKMKFPQISENSEQVLVPLTEVANHKKIIGCERFH
ncbi:uncharacterized protein [Fopius arisanus]|uniref:Reverse transcriptase domain-containing protein n=1 Tax=Fopius arisanus TaxID=64838 RepID=A0A9R1TQM2_9HYME|nr:PREDICTED: uncharacterized protein LOC105272723 [Fopius arisanus]